MFSSSLTAASTGTAPKQLPFAYTYTYGEEDKTSSRQSGESCSFVDKVDDTSAVLEVLCEIELTLAEGKNYDILIRKGSKVYKVKSTKKYLHLDNVDINEIAEAFEARIHELESFVSRYLFKGRNTSKGILEDPLEYEYDSAGNLISVRNKK